MLLELVNIPLQAAVWFGSIGFPVSAANAVGFGMFAFLLAQGASYWAVKLRRSTTASGPLPGRAAFAFARVANVPILAAGVVFTAWSTGTAPGSATIPGLAFALFAVLEHVNYFHVQLSYDTREDLRRLFTRGPRRSHLSRDLASGRPARPSPAPAGSARSPERHRA